MTSATPSRAFLTPFTVRSYELDGLGHLNHAVYLNYLEQARFETLGASGFPLAELERRQWAVHIVRIEADYRRECRFGDRLVVRTALEELRQSSMILRQELHRFGAEGPLPSWYPAVRTAREPRGGREPDAAPEGEIALEARVVGVWIGPEGRPMRIPGEIRDALGGSTR